MFKKGIMAFALMTLASNLYAGGPEVPAPYVGGIYLDVGASRSDTRDNFSSQYTVLFPLNNALIQSQINAINSGAIGWDSFIGIGYNYLAHQRCSIGLEMYADLSSDSGVQLQSNNPNFISGAINGSYLNRNTMQYYLIRSQSYGVSLLPGYYVHPGSLFYFDFGYVNSRFHLNAFPQQNSIYLGLASFNKSLNGLHLGLGTKTQIGSHIAINQEYVWEGYDPYSASTAGEVLPLVVFYNIPANYNGNISSRINPEIEKYNLSAIYYFARQSNSSNLNAAPNFVGAHMYVGLNVNRNESVTNSTLQEIQQTNINPSIGITNNFTTVNTQAFFNVSGWGTEAIIGYGYNFKNRWYSGVEMSGGVDSAQARYYFELPSYRVPPGLAASLPFVNGTQFISKLRKKSDFVLAFIPGFQVSDYALLYGRIGLVSAEFNIQNFWAGAFFTAAQNALLTHSYSQWRTGLQLGVGVDTLLNSNLSVRTEFDMNKYENIQINDLVSSVQNDDGSYTNRNVITAHRNLIENTFNVALIWHFYNHHF